MNGLTTEEIIAEHKKRKEECAALREALAKAERRVTALEGALRRANEALDRDRTGLAAALNKIRDELRGRYWMRHEKDGGEAGSWGCYPYPERSIKVLRKEISWAFDAIAKAAYDALLASGNLATEGCQKASAALAQPASAGDGPSKTEIVTESGCGCAAMDHKDHQ